MDALRRMSSVSPLGCALCPGARPLLHRSWYKKGFKLHNKLIFFGLNFLESLNKHWRQITKWDYLACAQPSLELFSHSNLNQALIFISQSYQAVYVFHIFSDCAERSSRCERQKERERACGGAGNVQREHFLPDNAAFFTELSNSSTTNWVLKMPKRSH